MESKCLFILVKNRLLHRFLVQIWEGVCLEMELAYFQTRTLQIYLKTAKILLKLKVQSLIQEIAILVLQTFLELLKVYLERELPKDKEIKMDQEMKKIVLNFKPNKGKP